MRDAPLEFRSSLGWIVGRAQGLVPEPGLLEGFGIPPHPIEQRRRGKMELTPKPRLARRHRQCRRDRCDRL